MPDYKPWQETPLMQFPVTGGLDTTSAPALVGIQNLTIAQNMIFGDRKTYKKRGGLVTQNSTAFTGNTKTTKLIDYWKAGSSGAPSQAIVAISGTKFYSSTNGGVTFSDISGAVSCPSDSVVAHCVVGDSLVMTFAATVPMVWPQTGNVAALTGTPPNGSVCAEHLARVWMNEKTDPHRLHFTGVSGTGDGDPTLWSIGNGGGSFTIEPDDGDPVGITALWQHNDQLYVAKLTKIYRIEGRTNESFRPILVANGIGCISHNMAVPIGGDVLFPSLRGFHSLAVLASTGVISNESLLSKKIHKTLMMDSNLGRFKNGHGTYLPEIDSVVWTLPLLGQTICTQALVFSLLNREWTLFTNFRCDALTRVFASSTNKYSMYTAGSTGFVYKYIGTTLSDYTSTSIDMLLRSGHVYPDLRYGHKWAFKKFVVLLYPTGDHNITLRYRTDAQKNSTGSFITTTLTESQGIDGAYVPMGSSFIMGTNLMGQDVFVQPLVFDLKGSGQVLEWELQNSENNGDLEIAGYYIELEPAAPHRNRV